MSRTSEQIRTAAEAVLAGTLFLLVLPLIVTGAALSLLQYRAWPFFVHDRVGEDGRTFRLLKVRTLPPHTDRYADKYAVNAAGVPPLMQLVRRLHLDELPQLLHVATGKMTFVGPRPEMPTLHASLPQSFAVLRTSVRPGLTCLWQISRHSAGLIGERSEYDRLYVDHRSFRLDLWIVARTIRKMTTGRTSHLFEVPRWAMRVAAPQRPFTAAPLEIDLTEPVPAAGQRSLSLVD
jgi:lipopolysaccharide/colanic/teichoic acid biosynthesis glycosyltransferase